MTGTGSRGNLLLLTAVAAVLALAVGLDPGGGGPAAAPDTRLLPGARVQPIRRVVIEHADGERLELAREPEGGFALVAPVRAPLEPAAVDDLIGTLELLSWRRQVDAGGAGLDEPRLTVTAELEGGDPIRLRLGDPVAATDQVWLARDGAPGAYLVDGAAARALDRRAADLRQRRPLATHGREVVGIEIHAGDQMLVLGGRPLAVHPAGLSGKVRADVAGTRSLLDLLDRLELTRFTDAAPGAPPIADGLRVRVIAQRGAAELTELGPCPGHASERLVRTSAGTGCAADADVAAIGLMAAFGRPLYDRHLLAVDVDRPRSIRIGSGPDAITLIARGGGWIGGAGLELDGEAVRAWGTAFDDLPVDEPTPAATLGPLSERGRIALDYGGGRIDEVLLHGDRRGRLWVGRAGEPILFPAGPAAPAVFAPALHPFLGRIRWQEHPTALRVATRSRGDRVLERIERGQLLEDWSVTAPAGAIVPRPVAEAVAEAGSRLVAREVVAGRATPAHGLDRPRAVIDLELADAAGGDAPIRHRITIGKAAPEGGCYATGDDQPAVLVLDADSCAALLGPWTRPRPGPQHPGPQDPGPQQ